MSTNNILIAVNIGLLVSYISTYICHNKITEYEKDLSDELKIKYNQIRKERQLHLSIGIFFSLLIAFIYVNKYPELDTYSKLIRIAFIVLLFPIVVYKIIPKTDYMLLHSQTEQDYKDWFDVYLCMKNQQIYGFLAGFTVSALVITLL